MYDAGDDIYSAPTPARLSLPFSIPSASPAPRRLSCSGDSARALPAARRPVPWVTLQGRLVGAHEATSAAAVGRGLAPEEAAAWELFSPLHRVLVVAIAAVASRESKRLRTISQLQRSVDLRDQVLESMQQKLEDLCEQMNSAKDQSIDCVAKVAYADGTQEPEGAEFGKSGHVLPELNPESGIIPLHRNPSHKSLKDYDGYESGSDVFKINQQEERRMSDLSDLCCSVTSSVDIQLSSLAVEQDIYNLRKECEEKDAKIKELSAAAHATGSADSKQRIMELEDIIRRKNMVITRMKKDMVVLEQKVIQLTRDRRPSATSNIKSSQLPTMANNLLYDMSSTSPSSSDSDSPAKDRECHSQGSVITEISERHSSKTVEHQRHLSVESLGSVDLGYVDEPTDDRLPKQRSVSPSYFIRRTDPSVALRPKRFVSSGGEFKRTKRHTQQEPKGKAPLRRWV